MVKLKGGAEKRVTQGQNVAHSGKGGVFQVVSHLDAVQRVKTNPKPSSPAGQLSLSKRNQAAQGWLRQRQRDLLKCLHFASVSSQVWEMPEVPAFANIFPTERKLRTLAANQTIREDTTLHV